MAGGEYLDWGYDAQGQLGDGAAAVSADMPVQVDPPGPVVQVVQGGLGDSTTARPWSWWPGAASTGGAPTSSASWATSGRTSGSPADRRPSPGRRELRQLATGACTSYGMTPSGTVYSWGGGRNGQIGNGGHG